ncbi:MAG TPA: ribosome silencing factor [Alloprevotella sp.]|nr:ribosome silencing factor [Alloprevotella sp.]
MAQKPLLVEKIIEGIQEKKGRRVVVADLTGITSAPAGYFVICTCGSPQQVEAVADSVEEFARKGAGEKPAAVAGLNNALWVAMDYGTVMVHIFVPEAREHYDLEHLWDDAALTEVPDLD